MTTVQNALEIITGKNISKYLILTSGNDLSSSIKNLSNKELPIHFNEVIEKIELSKIKDGFLLVSNHDLISYSEGIYKGINKIYTPRKIRELIKNEKCFLVK